MTVLLADHPRMFEPTNQRPPRILVIDADPEIARSIQREMAAFGVEVLRASDEPQGERMAELFQPDLIIADWQQPRQSRSEFLKRLRWDPATKHIPLCNLADQNATSDNESLGVEAQLRKPLCGPQLREELCDTLSLERPFA